MGEKTRARALPASTVCPGRGRASCRSTDGKLGPRGHRLPGAGEAGGRRRRHRHAPSRVAEQPLAAVDGRPPWRERGFGSRDVYLERQVDKPRHVEFQLSVTATARGAPVRAGLLLQRRHQKVVEEVPRRVSRGRSIACRSPSASRGTFGRLGYDNLGTVEMLRAPGGRVAFLEMNTRLQVEHAVTEEVTGVDIVGQSDPVRRRRADSPRSCRRDSRVPGHAVQARVYAEDPKRFMPSPGTFRGSPRRWGRDRGRDRLRGGRRSHAALRPAAREGDRAGRPAPRQSTALVDALGAFRIEGIKHNIPVLVAHLASDEFRAGHVHTGLAAEVVWPPSPQPVT